MSQTAQKTFTPTNQNGVNLRQNYLLLHELEFWFWWPSRQVVISLLTKRRRNQQNLLRSTQRKEEIKEVLLSSSSACESCHFSQGFRSIIGYCISIHIVVAERQYTSLWVWEKVRDTQRSIRRRAGLVFGQIQPTYLHIYNSRRFSQQDAVWRWVSSKGQHSVEGWKDPDLTDIN